MRGNVVKINSQDGKTRAGKPYVRWSFITRDDSGNESGWVTYGYGEQPPFVEGDLIEYEVETKGNFKEYRPNSGKIIKQPPRPATPSPPPGRAADGGNSPPSGQAHAGNNGWDARQQQIVLQHSQEMAISAVALLLSNDSLPTTGAKTKAGEAKRFEEIMAAVDKLTVKFHNDVVTGRLLLSVADMGIVDTKPDGAIPAAAASSTVAKSEEY